MEKEVPQAVFQVMDRIRSSSPKTGITHVIVKLDASSGSAKRITSTVSDHAPLTIDYDFDR